MSNDSEKAVISINGQSHILSGTEDLRRHLNVVRQTEYADVHLACELSGEAAVTFLLTNRERRRAYLWYLTDENPVGFHAVSNGASDAAVPVEFRLSNGQKDEWDISETVPLTDGLRALKHTFVNGSRAPFILWHDDSQDDAQ